jgi:myosin-18
LSDTRLLHEDQTNRNAVLEKKQRKFDTEFQLLQDELRQERANKERANRERDAAITDKLTSEQALQVQSKQRISTTVVVVVVYC